MAVSRSGAGGTRLRARPGDHGLPPTVFEAMPLPGGMMRYGIPSYRLPREVIDYAGRRNRVAGCGVSLRTPLRLGFGVSELKEQGYEAVF